MSRKKFETIIVLIISANVALLLVNMIHKRSFDVAVGVFITFFLMAALYDKKA